MTHATLADLEDKLAATFDDWDASLDVSEAAAESRAQTAPSSVRPVNMDVVALMGSRPSGN